MGGHDAGEIASQLAIQQVAQQAVNEILRPASAGESLPNAQQVLTAAVQAANQAVYERRRAAGTDMGTTLVAALVIGNRAVLANVGDSRGYHLTSQGITQVTVDHSLVERLIATGQITREEALTHPQKNVIYRTIGDKPRLEADLFERRLAPGEALLLCSDGLSGMVRDEQIWQLWRTSTSPQEACDRLVEAANQAGGEDNITVIIVQIGR
jgi:protein phosphatase